MWFKQHFQIIIILPLYFSAWNLLECWPGGKCLTVLTMSQNIFCGIWQHVTDTVKRAYLVLNQEHSLIVFTHCTSSPLISTLPMAHSEGQTSWTISPVTLCHQLNLSEAREGTNLTLWNTFTTRTTPLNATGAKIHRGLAWLIET